MDEIEARRHWLDDPPTVGAVLVSHNGARWLPKVLASFSNMFYAPAAWQVVDVSSTDGSAELLRDSFGPERITYAPSGTGFGEAVRRGVAELPETDWIWLLHDDASVLPGTLAGLLDTATSAPDIGAVGPKIREWPSLRRLLEVGLTVTATGSRETGLETGEPDAGQHDRPRDVLAVNTAGMLIRRDVWLELDGFDPNLPLYFDDIDFGWRLARAGYRTMTAPGAIIFHAESSTRGLRTPTAGDVPQWEKRRAAIYTSLANTPMPRFWWQYLRLFFGSLLRVVAQLVGKDPEAASDELFALRSAYLHPVKLARARRARAKTARRPHREIRKLFSPFWLPYQHGIDLLRHAVTAIVKPEAVPTVGRRSTAPDQTPDDVVDLDDGPSLLWRRPWLAVVVVLVVLSFIAGRGLLGGTLSGGALLPAPETAGNWWQLLFERQHDVGLPSTSLPALFVLPLAVVSTPIWFAPGFVVTVLMVFCVPLAALTAHRLGRQFSPHRAPRIVWAVSYGLMVFALGAVSEGRIGTVVALIIAPIIVNVGWQLAEAPGWQLALRLGIWISVAAAFAPIVLILGLGGLLILWYSEGRWVSRQLVVAAVTPLLLLGPWLIQRALNPWQVWWEAGLPVPGTAEIRDVVLGRATDGGLPGWLSLGVLVLAVLALIPRSTRTGVHVAWMVALLGLAVALVGTLVTFSPGPQQASVAPWIGVPTGLWLGALSTAVLLAVPAVLDWQRGALVAVIVAALILPVASAGWWLKDGSAGPLDDQRVDAIPVFLAERPGDTLILTGTIADGVEYRVIAGAGPFLGQEAAIPSKSSTAQMTTVVRRLVAQPTARDVEVLGALGVTAIYAPKADPELTRRVGSAPQLRPSGSDQPGAEVWTLPDVKQVDEPKAPLWHPIVMGAQIVIWIAAIILTLPVRRRRVGEVPAADDEVTA